MSTFPAVEQCVTDWFTGKITRAEVINSLLDLPTLEMQRDLLAQLPEFLEEARESVRPLASDETAWPGAYIPSTQRPRSLEEARVFEQLMAEAQERSARLYKFLSIGSNS